MQQVRVGEAVVPSRRRKFLTLRDLGIGIRLEEIENTFSREAKIDAGIAIELQRPVNALRCSLNAGVYFGREVLGRPVQDASPLLVVRIMLDLLGSDAPRAFSHIAELQFPNRQHPQPVVAEHPDIKLTPLDVLLSNGRRTDSFVN